jgi:hypothetical protein
VNKDEAVRLTERKVVRRGLLTGIGALGAALAMKVSGAGKATKAEATDGQSLKIGNVLIDGSAQTAQSTTSISCSPPFANFGFLVGNGVVPSAPGASGVGGATNASAGAGIFGLNLTGAGVLGSGSPGVFGQSLQGVGMRGITGSATGVGLEGIANDSNLVITTGNGAGTGVLGKSGSGTGVRGQSGSGTGVFGRSTSQPGVHGESTSGLGVRGISTHFVAMVGISQGNHGLYGSTSNAASAGFVGENLAGGLAGYFAGHVYITGNLQVDGAKNAVIKMQDGTKASVYCQESPEPYFEDFGRAQLSGGVPT